PKTLVVGLEAEERTQLQVHPVRARDGWRTDAQEHCRLCQRHLCLAGELVRPGGDVLLEPVIQTPGREERQQWPAAGHVFARMADVPLPSTSHRRLLTSDFQRVQCVISADEVDAAVSHYRPGRSKTQVVAGGVAPELRAIFRGERVEGATAGG